MQSTWVSRQGARWRWTLVLPLMVLGGLTGCSSSDGLDRQPVSGAVTLDGTPLATGTIQFTPASSEATTDTGATIAAGKYAFTKENGPVPGNYKVTISSVEPPKEQVKQGMVPGDYRPSMNKDLVPAKYNTQTTLTASVKAGQGEPINFALTTK